MSEEPVYRISDMVESERPRERLINHGAKALSDAELIAILVRTGTKGENVLDVSRKLLSRANGLRGLKRLTVDELKEKNPGIGTVKACEIMAVIELGRRFAALPETEQRIRISNPDDIYNYVHYEMESLDHEELWVINLDIRHCVVSTDHLYSGSLNSSTVRIAEVFRTAIVKKLAAIVMVHNHPSGDPMPSAADISVTKTVQSAGNLLEIHLIDHLIIGDNKYQSVLNLIA